MSSLFSASPTGAPNRLIRLHAASIGYGERVLIHDAEWNIERRDCWFLLGANGAGKSTLVKSLLGLLPLCGGTITREVALQRDRGIAYVPQRCDIRSPLRMSVQEFVSLGLTGLALSGAEARSRVQWALSETGLETVGREDYQCVSGGQRQRALLARALVRHPELLILDEPTSALDIAGEAAFLATLAELNRGRGLTMVMVTHDIPLALREASHLAVIADGRLATGSAPEIIESGMVDRALGRVTTEGQAR